MELDISMALVIKMRLAVVLHHKAQIVITKIRIIHMVVIE
jgi:hypothetical protein